MTGPPASSAPVEVEGCLCVFASVRSPVLIGASLPIFKSLVFLGSLRYSHRAVEGFPALIEAADRGVG